MIARSDFYLHLLQRGTAVVMVPLVLIHVVVILIAVEGGLSAAEILSRTKDSIFWASFYSIFVVAAAVHGSLGLRNVIRELTPLEGTGLNALALAVCVVLLVLGIRAVGAVT